MTWDLLKNHAITYIAENLIPMLDKPELFTVIRE